MGGALTIAILFALSFGIVRIAAIAMRLTGLPENVARFQSISALTGTGFSTTESELIVNYPIRRRILVALMIIGNLGLVSIAGTFIVSFVDAEPVPGARAWQAVMIVTAIGITLLVITNKALDRAMCALVGIVLRKTTSLGKRRFQCMLQVGDDFSVSEHVYRGSDIVTIGALTSGARQLSFLAIRRRTGLQSAPFQDDTGISQGDVLICYGSDAAHNNFEDSLSRYGWDNQSGKL